MKLKTGTKVQIEKRDVTPQDMADRLYFSYFGGLTGTVDRIFDDGSVCVDVDLESCPRRLGSVINRCRKPKTSGGSTPCPRRPSANSPLSRRNFG